MPAELALQKQRTFTLSSVRRKKASILCAGSCIAHKCVTQKRARWKILLNILAEAPELAGPGQQPYDAASNMGARLGILFVVG